MHLLPDDIHQHLLSAAPVELRVEDRFPRAEVQPSLGDRYHDFAAHYLSLAMRVAVVLTGAVVAERLVWG